MTDLMSAAPGRRLLARVIDVALAGTVGAVLAVVWIDWAVDTSDDDWGVLGLLIVAAAIVVATVAMYEVVFVAWRGQTPGKRVTKVRVVRTATGGRVGPMRAAMRLVPFAAIVVPVFGYLWAFVAYGSALFDQHGRGWHDRLAGTRVVSA